ncbi:MAG: trypsin-like peptidase domain-containing protein [Candidatus Omnitrophica bacterium]|nr:trypsin-like peptidase domain-containing protein [Candidatus Omnitrophota bacterium]
MLSGLRSAVVEIIAEDASHFRKGAGVVMRRDGLIVCNMHTVQGASRILIRYDRTGRRPARIIRVFPEYDLILLKIDPPAPLSPVRLAGKQDVSLRQTVYHIGSSFLLDGTISEGRITGLGSSKSEIVHGNKDIDIIRLDIQLFKGDSGGPLFDQEGRLIGMVVAADTTRDRVSFAVPVNKIKKILSAP